MISLMKMEHLDLHAKKPTETPNSYNFERCVNPTARLINLCGYQKYRLINRVHILLFFDPVPGAIFLRSRTLYPYANGRVPGSPLYVPVQVHPKK